ncbi:hypothetical protein AB0F42_26480 [Streptomyces buecherae]|uniref:hypothetical protein n=1 Tax=Streptomyces buecherae TaxID=2763006 RepID=UPI0033D33097
MFGSDKRQAQIVVLRDIDSVRKAVANALVTASDQERPGLARAAALIEAEANQTDAQIRARWANRTVSDAGVDLGNHVEAVAAIRKAVPGGLRLTDANRLIEEAADHI